MDLYAEANYKTALKSRLKELRKERKGFTLEKLAAKLPLQYTHLSRVLSKEELHLSEQHLFALCRLLEFFPEEIDYLFLLRSFAMATDSNWREHLSGKLGRVRQARQLNATIQDYHPSQLNQEMAYLFDPTALLVHVGLTIPEYSTNVRALGTVLGLTPKRLREIIKKLGDLGFIRIDETPSAPVRVLKRALHYSQDHPLMRVHQSLMRDASAARINSLASEDKHSIMVTFSSDEATLDKIKESFQRFIKEVEKLAQTSRRRKCFQLSFDLFPWF